jgi:hypothetical protein
MNPSDIVIADILMVMIVILTIISLIYRSSEQDYSWLKRSILCVFILGTALHMYVYYQIPSVTENGAETISFFSALVISAVSSAQMFLAGTRIFDNGFQDYLFTDEGTLPLMGLSFLYILSIGLSSFVLLNFFFLRLFSKWQLKYITNRLTKNPIVHIFFGNNPQTAQLAKDIQSINLKENKKEMVIIIEYPQKDEISFDSSFTTKIHELISGSRNNDYILHLKAKMNLAEADISDKRIEDILDLRGLDEWVFRTNSHLYFLSNNENENLKCLNIVKSRIESMKATMDLNNKIGRVFCHAKKEGNNIEIEDFYRQVFDVTFIDSSYLSIQQLIREKTDTLPIKCVSITEKGYVDSNFEAVIFGFGELGQHALDFLYEYGAFIGKEHKRSPFKLLAYDKSMDSLKKSYIERHPGMKCDFETGNIDFRKADITAPYLSVIQSMIPFINYYVICLGDDNQNWTVAHALLELLEKARKENSLPDKYTVLIKQSNPNIISSTLDKLDIQIRKNVHFFGDLEHIWKYKIITNSELEKEAREFSARYEFAADCLYSGIQINPDDDNYEEKIKAAKQKWNEREEKLSILETPNTDQIRINKKKLLRQRYQDYANTLHMSTKMALLNKKYNADELREMASIIPNVYSEEIKANPNVFSEQHCLASTNNNKDWVELLTNLAVGEHIRWMASHAVLGYQDTDNDTDDNKQIHKYMKDYDKLKDKEPGKIRHYDWLVVKTTLELYANKISLLSNKL